MQTRTRNAVVLGAIAVAVSAGIVYAERTRQAEPLSGGRAMDAIPAGALLVATADLTALRAAGAFGALMQQGREIQGVGKVKDICGFDPIEQIEDVAFAIPAAGDTGEFGLAASGKFDEEALLACAAKVVQARQGRPVTTPIGSSFRSVHDGGHDGGASSSGEIAVRRGGTLLLLGGGSYLRAMIDASEGRVPSVHRSAGHAELARATGDGAIRVTFVLTPEQRRSMSASMGATTTLAAGGLSVALGLPLKVHAALRCDDAGGAAALAKALDGAKAERAGDLSVRVMGFGALLDKIDIKADGPYVHARVDLPPEEAAHLLDVALKLRGFKHPMPGAPDAAASPRPELPAPAGSGAAAEPATSASSAPSAAPSSPSSPSSAKPR